MTDKMNKLNENQLEQVVGGKKRYVQNDAGANVRSGPGTDYSRWYHLDEGDVCYTNGERVYSRADGYDWVQLEDGGSRNLTRSSIGAVLRDSSFFIRKAPSYYRSDFARDSVIRCTPLN